MNSELSFILNNEEVHTSINPSIILLDFIRKHKKLTGTKEGCREGDCGACTVLIGEIINGKVIYQTINSCLLPVIAINGKHIVTIEGLNSRRLNPIQQAIVDEGATQCGFCTPGFIISLTGYFLSGSKINYEGAVNYIGGNICRCTGYTSIKRSVHKVIDTILSQEQLINLTIKQLVKQEIIPAYFESIPARLKKIDIKTSKKKNNIKSKVLIAGGTDLFVQKPDELLSSSPYPLSEKEDLKEIKVKNDKIVIGACITVSEFQGSKIIKKYFPELNGQLNLFGSAPIRNRATIGGNIINASPIGDITNILISLNASLHFYNGIKERLVPLKNFFLGYKLLDKKKNEILKYISIPIPKGNFKFNFEKVSRRSYLDIASVNSSIYIQTRNNHIREVNISAGGVAPIPLYLKKTCEYLSGKTIKSENILEAAEIAKSEISPIGDVRGSVEYKNLLLHQLIFAHFVKLFPSQINLEELV